MTHEERNIAAGILTNILLNGYFAWHVWSKYQDGAFAGSDGLQIWARTVLWIIPIGIVFAIVIMIMFNILYAIVTRTPKPSFIVDERDKVIGRKAILSTTILTSIALFFSVIALALGWSAFAAFNILFFGCGIASLGSDLTKMYFHRRGY